jgi:Na+/H+-dicarboxylate symporter
MVVVPLVFASITVGTCGLGDAKKVGRIGGKTILFYLCTTALAVTLGLLAANLFPVGRGLGQVAQESAGAAGTTVSVADTLLNIVPTNPVAALAEGNMLQIIFFALCLGGAILLIGEKGRPLLAVCDSLAEAMYALTGFIMKLAPVAVFALIAPVVAELGPRVLLAFLGVILVVYGACLLHMLVGYSIAVGGIARVNPLTFFRTALPALVFAFSSASSAGTLPFSMEAARRLGVPAPVRSFVLPLGATINMDGTAIYQGVCALFIANAYGIPLDLGQQVTIVLTCTLASVGTAGVPGAGVVMLTMVLQTVGLPVEGVALVAGIDRVLDMARTTVNITGDIACSAVVAATEGGLKPERP